MKKTNKYLIKGILACVLLAGSFVSCSESTLDGINNNNNNPLNTEAKFLITDLEVSTAFDVVGGDFSLYSSIYIEHETGVHNQMYNAETRSGEPTSSTTYNNTWNQAYSNIKKAKLVIEKCSQGGPEEGSNITLGIAKVYLAYNAAVLTDLFGDVPYFQAGILDENFLPVYWQPKVDKQEDIYKDITKQLDEAIVLFDKKDAGLYGAVYDKDLLYKGNGAAWKKVAYGLKARYGMRLLGKATNQVTALDNILTNISKSFASADEEFKLDIYDGSSQSNPLGSFSVSRLALGASKSFVNKLTERNDPRLTQIIFSTNDWEVVTNPANLNLPDNGSLVEAELGYDFYISDFTYSAPTQLLSYHELLFLKAEALARKSDPTAEGVLKQAITAGFANYQKSVDGVYEASYFGNGANLGKDVDLSATVADAYFTSNVKPLFAVNPLKEVMIQKYLTFMGANGESIEAYNDYRRLLSLNEKFITLENAKNTTQFPHRFVYGNSDVLANPNIGGLVGDGTYVYKEKVWWAGGTR